MGVIVNVRHTTFDLRFHFQRWSPVELPMRSSHVDERETRMALLRAPEDWQSMWPFHRGSCGGRKGTQGTT
jgi:hypothetical protein